MSYTHYYTTLPDRGLGYDNPDQGRSLFEKPQDTFAEAFQCLLNCFKYAEECGEPNPFELSYVGEYGITITDPGENYSIIVRLDGTVEIISLG